MKPEKHREDFDWQAQTGAKPFHLRPKNPRAAIWMGYVVSQVVGLGAIALVTLIWVSNSRMIKTELAALFILGQLFLIPFGMGMVASYFWLEPEAPDATPDPTRGYRAYQAMRGSSFLSAVGFCVLASLVLGPIVLLLSPLLWSMIAVGMRVGASFWRKNPFLS